MTDTERTERDRRVIAALTEKTLAGDVRWEYDADGFNATEYMGLNVRVKLPRVSDGQGNWWKDYWLCGEGLAVVAGWGSSLREPFCALLRAIEESKQARGERWLNAVAAQAAEADENA